MSMILDNKFDYEEIVYLKTDTDQLPRMVYGFIVYKTAILYRLTCGSQTSEHYDFEITRDKQLVLSLKSHVEDDEEN